MQSSLKVKVIDNISGTTLAEYPLDKMDDAYKFAAEMEENGLDIKVDAPDIHSTLAASLGMTEEDLIAYRQTVKDEIDGHNDSCSSCIDDTELGPGVDTKLQ